MTRLPKLGGRSMRGEILISYSKDVKRHNRLLPPPTTIESLTETKSDDLQENVTLAMNRASGDLC
jgi:hypothetical protein